MGKQCERGSGGGASGRDGGFETGRVARNMGTVRVAEDAGNYGRAVSEGQLEEAGNDKPSPVQVMLRKAG